MNTATLLLPLSLLFVGAVLVLNGLWMMRRIEDREIKIINFVTATITGTVAILILINARTPTDVSAAVLTLLFSVTYLWIGFNRIAGADGRGLGWFSLFVAISVLPRGLIDLFQAQSVMDVWLSLNWLIWSGLWFLYFLRLGLQKNLGTQTAIATLVAGVTTAWLPALLILYGATA